MSGPPIASPQMLRRISLFTMELKLYNFVQALERHYSPSQPRVPAGNPDGGEWTGGTGRNTSDGAFRKIVETARHLRLSSANPNDRQRCLELCVPLLERPPQQPGSDINYWDFQKCMNECLGKNI